MHTCIHTYINTCMRTCIHMDTFLHVYAYFLAPMSIFCSIGFVLISNCSFISSGIGASSHMIPQWQIRELEQWPRCGICGQSTRPPLWQLRHDPWPNIVVLEWVKFWRIRLTENGQNWVWDYEWREVPCHAGCVMEPRAGGA